LARRRRRCARRRAGRVRAARETLWFNLRADQGGELGMLKQRTITGLVLAPIGIAAVLLLPTAALAVFTSITVLVAMWEWTRLAGFASRPARSAVVALVMLTLAVL